MAWLRSSTPLPIILKGILTREDGARAVEAGVAGVWVSNHGGRQLDTVLSSAEALAEVLEGVRGAEGSRSAQQEQQQQTRLAVWVDGGVRRGTDVVKLLALGADFVWVGKPIVWGLGAGGEEGVLKLLDILSSEVKNTLQLLGKTSISSVGKDCVAWVP